VLNLIQVAPGTQPLLALNSSHTARGNVATKEIVVYGPRSMCVISVKGFSSPEGNQPE
jgi:hypothetical protein